LDKLLSLEPRTAGGNVLEPHAEFAELPDMVGRCYETTQPTCVGWTVYCVNTHECQPT
jgi:hypothetical protein